jgi:hypothetical protein
MQEQQVKPEEKVPDHPQPGPNVTVTVDNVMKTVHRGHYTVAKFKQAVGVDASKELDEIVNGEIKPLDDTANLVIKGGEVFISHARTGGSS